MLSQADENPTRFVSTVRWLGERPLFRRDIAATSTSQVIGWWESRRPSYNLIVGGVGIFTCAAILMIAATAAILFHSDFGAPNGMFAIFGIVVYGILANVCYTGGWITELLVRKLWPEEADRFAKTTFSVGLTFSVFLTLLPAFILGGMGFLEFVARLFRLHH